MLTRDRPESRVRSSWRRWRSFFGSERWAWSGIEKNELGDLIGEKANDLKEAEDDNIRKAAGYLRGLFGAD